MDNVSSIRVQSTGFGTVTNPGPWSHFSAGESLRCPAPNGPEGAPCGRRLRDVGAGLSISVRVRAHQGFDKPTKGMTMEKCGKCGTVLECKEERV